MAGDNEPPIPQGEDGWLDELEAAAKKVLEAAAQKRLPVTGMGQSYARHMAFLGAKDRFGDIANPEAALRLIAIARAAGGKHEP